MELLAAHHMASRDNPVISLEEAHWRLSAHPAMCAGFRNRGTLVEGAAAEIVVYDLERLKVMPMKIAHDFPGNEWRVARFEFTSLPHPEHRTQKGKWPTPRISPNV
jgi:N-acyl-D-aspartate/D-glutamate deacylase